MYEGGDNQLMTKLQLLLGEIDHLARNRVENRTDLIAKLHEADLVLRVASNKLSLVRDDLEKTLQPRTFPITCLPPLRSIRRRLQRLHKVLNCV